MRKAPWLDERQERAWRALQFMQMRLEAALARQLADDSTLSYPDYLVLVALTDEIEGRLRPYELAEILGWEQSRVSHHVTRMTRRGLVEKQECDADRRGAYVAVTQTGRRELAAAAPGHARAVRHWFIDRVTPEQLDVIAEAAETVLTHLESGGVDDGSAVGVRRLPGDGRRVPR